MPSSNTLKSSDAEAFRSHTPTVMVSTPEGTRKPNGITPPPSGRRTPSASYNPADYMSAGPTGPSIQTGRISPAPIRLTSTGDPDANGTGAVKVSVPGASAYPVGTPPPDHDSPSLRLPKRPGDAASYYAGTPPAFPPPPNQFVGEFSMSGALPHSSGPMPSYTSYPTTGPMPSYSTGPHGQGNTASMLGPAGVYGPSQSGPVMLGRERGIKACRIDAEGCLQQYFDLQNRLMRTASPSLADKERLRRLGGRALHESRDLRRELAALIKRKEGGRIGRFVVGGIVAGTIPLIKRFFGRPPEAVGKQTKTEYAFSRSHSMVTRILATLHKSGWVATVFMMVLATLYVFQAEVMIRVARTVHKRLRKLVIRLEEGERLGKDGILQVDERDVDVLRGWRWRILLWTK